MTDDLWDQELSESDIAVADRDEEPSRGAFLRVLHSFRADRYTEIRYKNASGKVTPRHFKTPTEVDTFIAGMRGQHDVWFGVATRTNHRGGTKKDCSEVSVFWCDLDFKDFNGADEVSREAAARALLDAFPLRPNLIVHSGGGLHVYWLLRRPLLIAEHLANIEAILNGLAHRLHGDEKAAEVARVLRLPETLNYKYNPPRPVRLELFDVSRRYEVAQFEFLSTPPPDTDPTPPPDDADTDDDDRDALLRRARAYLKAIPPAIEGQAGDEHTFTTACKILRGFNLTDEDTFEVFREWNARCVPPWDEKPLKAKIASARKNGTEPFGSLAAAVILEPNDPVPSAREFVAREHTIEGTITLRHQSAMFVQYLTSAGAYLEQDEPFIRASVYRFLESAQRRHEKGRLIPFQPTRSKVENVVDALRAVTNLPTTTKAPCWLQHAPGLAPVDILAAPNGLVHIPTRAVLPPTPNFFTFNAIDFPYDPWAPRPIEWLTFLDTLWPDDPESIATLQELFGHLLTPDTRFQKIWMFVGPKRSGKGTIARILRRLVGDRNTRSPTLAAFGRDFGKAVLIGKTLAIISDARIGGRTDTASVAEALLAISGEDGQTIARKFLPDWDGKLPTRFVVITNELPHITDVSGALASRFILFALKESFYGREDHGLYDRLVPELPGILLWALDGRDRLYARGHFQQPQSADDLLQAFIDLGSFEAAFLREHTEVSIGFCSVPQDDLFALWKVWCELNGVKKPGTTQSFAKSVHAVYPWIVVKRLGPRGDQVRSWMGISVKDPPSRD